MSRTPQPLTRKLGRPFWFGLAVTAIVSIMFFSALGMLRDNRAFWLFACVAIGMVGPVGGLLAQAIHDLFLARRLHLLRALDFLLLAAITAACLGAGYISHRAQGESHAHWVAGALVSLLIFAYAKRKGA